MIVIDMITETDENAIRFLMSGDEAYFSGDLDTAIDKYETVILAKESNLSPYVLANAHYNIAMVHFEKGDYGASTKELNDCIGLLQDYQDKHNRLHAPAMSLHKFAHILLNETARMESQRKSEEQNTMIVKQGDVDSIFPSRSPKNRRGVKRWR